MPDSSPHGFNHAVDTIALMQTEKQVIQEWSATALFWDKHREIIRQLFAPVTDALVEDAQIGAGHTVLDIATGQGEPALSLAALVGPEGKVFGIDPVPEMVAAAARAADKLGFHNTQFEVAFADHLPYPNDTFDAVVSRFGVMFISSPVDAVRQILRVLKPGRKLSMAVWHSAETNPFLSVLQRVVEKYSASPPVAEDAPGAFRYARLGKLRDIFVEADAAAPTERLLQFRIKAPISVEDFWALRCEMSEKLRELVAKLSAQQLADFKSEALEVLGLYSTDSGMSFPAEVLIVTGTKSIPV